MALLQCCGSEKQPYSPWNWPLWNIFPAMHKSGFQKASQHIGYIMTSVTFSSVKDPHTFGKHGEWGKGILLEVLSWPWEKNSTKFNLFSSIGYLFLLNKLRCNEENQSVLVVEMWGSSQKYFWGSYKYMKFIYLTPEELSNTNSLLSSHNR